MPYKVEKTAKGVQKIDWLQDSYEQIGVILHSSWKLEGISSAVRITGNDNLALQLEGIARDLLLAQERISGDIAESINERFKASQEASVNIVKTALAVAEIDSQNAKPEKAKAKVRGMTFKEGNK